MSLDPQEYQNIATQVADLTERLAHLPNDPGLKAQLQKHAATLGLDAPDQLPAAVTPPRVSIIVLCMEIIRMY